MKTTGMFIKKNSDKCLLKEGWLVVATFAIALICVLALFMISGYAPFGTMSLASGDINYSQMDLYSYLKDVLEGRNTFGYTLSLYLGGVTSNVISYSMTSPLNLMVLLFPKAEFEVMFDLMTALKIALIAGIMSFYLRRRFNGRLGDILNIALSLSYGFSQYAIAQIVNIFWLDGMMMLPLVLLGIYEAIRFNRKGLMAASIALSLIMNWYTGAINCIFCVFWFILEVVLYASENGCSAKQCVSFALRCCIGGAIGVLIASCVLIPTFMAIGKGNRGEMNWESFTATFAGNMMTAISNDLVGSLSSPSVVSLYCGGLAVVGCLALFLDSRVAVRRKLTFGAFLLFTGLAFYWQPFRLLFSMFKNAASFWFRYGYIGIFPIVFIAAVYFSEYGRDNKKAASVLSRAFAAWTALLLILHMGDSSESLTMVYVTLGFFLLACLAYGLFTSAKKRAWVALFSALVIVVTCVDMSYNASLIMKTLEWPGVEDYRNYVADEEKRIEELKAYDEGQYRISQTLTRNAWGGLYGGTTANYNEPLGYGYWSLTGYTNSPDDRQRGFLNKLGYRINGENFYVVNTSLLGADSLLGVKYLMSPIYINGYEEIPSMEECNFKKVFENPYALPMAFLCKVDPAYLEDLNVNEFLFQNRLFSALVGRDVELYKPLEYVITADEGKHRAYEVAVPEGRYAVYGNLPWYNETKENILLNGEFLTIYAQWCSQSLFYIPVEFGQRSFTLEVVSDNGVSISETQLFALDLDLLDEVTEEIRKGSDLQWSIENKRASFEFDSAEDGDLLMSIAYDEGWEIRDNGERIEPEMFADCLIKIPCAAGPHRIEMRYHVPGIKRGLVLSLIGILAFAGNILFEKKRRMRKA